MSKTSRPWLPGQTSLLLPSPSDWLSADHQVPFLLDLADELDLSAIVIPAQAKDPRSEKGFDPPMMTLLLLDAYCYEDLAFRVLTGNQQPDHSRISEFRRRNLEAWSALFVQILRLCQDAGMVSLGYVLDGTKVQAKASKHKAMSDERMLKAEAQLEKEIRELMRKAELRDAQEDSKYGKGKLGSDLPKELQRREDRLEKIRQPVRHWKPMPCPIAAWPIGPMAAPRPTPSGTSLIPTATSSGAMATCCRATTARWSWRWRPPGDRGDGGEQPAF